MQPTQRNLNECQSCGYTWYPRGHNISIKCPNCESSDNVEILQRHQTFWGAVFSNLALCIIIPLRMVVLALRTVVLSIKLIPWLLLALFLWAALAEMEKIS